jgi:hypothetical protein
MLLADRYVVTFTRPSRIRRRAARLARKNDTGVLRHRKYLAHPEHSFFENPPQDDSASRGVEHVTEVRKGQ